MIQASSFTKKTPRRVSYIEVNRGTGSLSNLPQVSLLVMAVLSFKPSQLAIDFALVTTMPYCLSGHIFWMSQLINEWMDSRPEI